MLDVIEFITIYNKSPLHHEIPEFNLNLRWIKIKWNQAGARNLGILSAKSDKFIITDLDHVFYEDTLKFMVDSDFKRGEIYKFRRTHIHKNGFIAGNYPSTAMYLR
ncbi:glycosyltransferase family A protein [uncultured Campylobacter sp.]|uniref:glycosyltransferase family A protein n=1 Tax=uncultured Campylobacter sp. TaxID=218934 RepID=UPI002628BAC7|nr:glycosyltransferase family A protein [uncultured Campylobacter sp.]